MKRGDIVKGQAFWPRGPKRGEKVKFEAVVGTLEITPSDVTFNETMAWIKNQDGEFRAVYASTVEVLEGSLTREPDPASTVRARVLDEAKRITSQDRNTSYGDPADNFQRIADFWNVFLQDKLKDDAKITAGDTAALVILVKLAREMNAPTEDNKVDIAGYAACWAEVDAKS